MSLTSPCFILSLQIYTVADRSEIEYFVPSAKEVNRYYDPKLALYDDLKEQLGELLSKVFHISFTICSNILSIIYFFFYFSFLT